MISILAKRPVYVWHRLIAFIPIFIIIGCSTNDKLTGTADTTDTGIVAMLYNPNGTPAIGANVKVFKSMDSSKVPIQQIMTDQNGRYSLTGLPKGAYNVYAQKDSLVAFQDSVAVLDDTILVKNDTLEKSISITAVVGLQPNHDPRTVTVQVLGSDIFSNVNEAGDFTLSKLGSGNYTLKLFSTLPNYTNTFKQLNITANFPDTLKDTLWLIYTGIPVVENITATYDTLNGVVKLKWKSTKYRDFQDYLIYRDNFDSLHLSSLPINFTTDTVFYDTVFHRSTQNGTFSFNDSNDYHFKYRVIVRNNSQQEGLSYKYISIVAASPQKVKTIFSHQSYHLNKGFFSDSASINDTIRFTFNLNNYNRFLVNVNYVDLEKDTTLYSHRINRTNLLSDTLLLAWANIGIKRVEIAATDNGGTIWKDTILFQVIKDNPTVHISTSKIILNAPTKIQADVSDKFGHIVKCEWQIGNSKAYTTTSSFNPETTITINDTLISSLKCILRATDDDGNISYDSSNLSMSIQWEKIELPSNMNSMFNAVEFQSKIYVFSFGNFPKVWASENGKDWNIIYDSPTWSYRVLQPMVHNGQIWLLETGNNPAEKTILWHSSNGFEWNAIDISGKVTGWAGYNYLFFAAHNDSLYFCYTREWNKGEGQLLSTFTGIEWDTLKSANQVGIESPFIGAPCSYYTASISGQLYISTYPYPMSSSQDGPKVWATSNWANISVIQKFNKVNSSGIGTTPTICKAFNKLCLFMYSGSQYEYSGKMLYLDNYGNFTPCSDLPVSEVRAPIEFLNRLFLVADNEIWISK